MPEIEEDEDGGRRYANDQDREAAEQKMRAVMRIASNKGLKHLVLGAWGCGAYGNPVSEIAAAWRRVLLGDEKAKTKAGKKQDLTENEKWDGMGVVFAIKDGKMAELFAKYFGTELETSLKSCGHNEDEEGSVEQESSNDELRTRIEGLEAQIAAARSDLLKDRLQSVLEKLRASE